MAPSTAPGRGTLIVGASQAGLSLGSTLRDNGDRERLVLVGAESLPPYQRPPLSKGFLFGRSEVPDLALRGGDFYDRADIEVVTDERVVALALDGSGTGTATLASGRHLDFDRLALTTGARPRRLVVPGGDLDGVCYLRQSADATDLRARLHAAADVVVVGGGFVGLEVAAVATAISRRVTVVETADRLLGRAVAPVVSEFYLGAHARRGTRVLLETTVSEFRGASGRLTGVALTDGRELPADLVLVGIGVEPRTELADQVGLAIDGGIVVDQQGRTSNPAVFAAGDCACSAHPLSAVGRLRLESVDNAVSQGRAAAHAMLGLPPPPPSVPWFWSDQADLKLQIAGITAGYDTVVVRGDPVSEHFSVLYYRDERLLGVDAVNRPADYMAVRRALGDGTGISAAQAHDTSVSLKDLLIEGRAARETRQAG